MALLSGWRITRTGIVFVLGVIVLSAAVFGGIWLASNRGEQARRQEAAKIAQQNLEEQSKTAKNTNTHNGVVKTPATDTKTDTISTPIASRNSTQLPQTGADLNQIVIITLLTLAGTYYLTSRRAVRDL